MAARRTKSISAKVTEAEYAQLVTQAGDRTVSEWVRTTVLAAASPAQREPIAFVALTEQIALREVILNLHYLMSRGEKVTVEKMQQLIDDAERDKVRLARKWIAAAARPAVTP
jgi:hypothetical protein